MKKLFFYLTLVFLGCTFASAEEEKKAVEAGAESKPILNYYFLEGWFLCDKIKVIVDDLEKVYGTEVTFKKTSTKEKGALQAISDAKVVGHGIIATDVDGKLIATANGHNYGKEKVERIVKKLLKTVNKKTD